MPFVFSNELRSRSVHHGQKSAQQGHDSQYTNIQQGGEFTLLLDVSSLEELVGGITLFKFILASLSDILTWPNRNLMA